MTNEILRMQLLSGVITESEYKAKLEESLWDRIKNAPKAWLAKIKGDFPAIMVKSLEDSGIKVGKPVYFYERDNDRSKPFKERDWVLHKAEIKSVNYNTGDNDIMVQVSRDGGNTWEVDEVESLRSKLGLQSDLSKLQTMDEKQLQAWYEKQVAANKNQFELKNVAYDPKDLKKPLNENFVGIGMVGNIFDREKTDYELAFEYFTKGTSLKENEETSLTSSSEYKKILSILKDNPEEVEALEKVQDELETLTEEEYYTKEDLKKLLKNAGIGALTSTLFSALVASFPGMSAADIVQTVLAGLGIGAVAGAYAGHKADKGITETHPLEGGPGYMTKHHAGVLTRLISDLESEDTSKFPESNLENYEKTLSSLKAALEASKAKYKEETGKDL